MLIFQVSPLIFMKRQTLTWISSNYLPHYQSASAALVPLASPLCSSLTILSSTVFLLCALFYFDLLPVPRWGLRWRLRRWVKQEKEEFVREGEIPRELKMLRWNSMSQHPSEPVASMQQRWRKSFAVRIGGHCLQE